MRFLLVIMMAIIPHIALFRWYAGQAQPLQTFAILGEVAASANYAGDAANLLI
nr:hypothetical protein [Yersinia enterocolitica]